MHIKFAVVAPIFPLKSSLFWALSSWTSSSADQRQQVLLLAKVFYRPSAEQGWTLDQEDDHDLCGCVVGPPQHHPLWSRAIRPLLVSEPSPIHPQRRPHTSYLPDPRPQQQDLGGRFLGRCLGFCLVEDMFGHHQPSETGWNSVCSWRAPTFVSEETRRQAFQDSPECKMFQCTRDW